MIQGGDIIDDKSIYCPTFEDEIMIQGGDITDDKSIYCPAFEDESLDLKHEHNTHYLHSSLKKKNPPTKSNHTPGHNHNISH
ncbi:hypothetical protein Fmac_000467 [Flemingia macrophylla]|uniref:Uncharacterized protein n=1 Tax=Flemingia macrophylla TaxID=520843 RepID=A0ABD1NEB9_9FABA